jgi:alkanesulfonate monooxygenase SsuD/methylene tetrahydromethanopterin reductase-like flavin-dependent oxidoreductase (luciferase family)
MQAWYLNENPYPFVPQHVLDSVDSVRASLPNKYCDPRVAADLFEEALDEYLLCDDLGINVVSNEHHSGINCLFGASPLILGILARQTRRVRILSLGTLVTVRKDPVRVAEEYASADVISRGRLDIGFVKSGGTEMASGNTNPVGNVERFWEAIDLIRKALTHQEGPFSWEGKHFTHRHVNIWPRPWQQPHPPLWAATGDPETSAELGRRDMVNVLVFRGVEGTQRAWAAYRKARVEAGLPAPGPDRFGYTAFVYAGDTDEEGVRVGSKLLWFLNTGLKSAPQYSRLLPGQTPPEQAPPLYRTAPGPGSGTTGTASASRNAATLVGVNAEQAMARALMFAGNPDTVYRQIREFQEKVGKFEHLILASRSGFMTHAEAKKGLTLFAKEVLPRLRDSGPE